MATIDPITGRPLPGDAIQRVLHITARVHVYQIPPMQSSKGYTAATWTDKPPIFTARLRVMETALKDNVTTAVLLEDGNSGELFAAAPYNHPSVVSAAVDSSRFFAVRVQGEGGMKATLGVGFEERGDAIDFNLALQDAIKVLGLKGNGLASSSKKTKAEAPNLPKKDYSLKEGETITINIGNKPGRRPAATQALSKPADLGDSGSIPLLPPPPSAADVKRANRLSQDAPLQTGREAEDEFGDFQ